jgi:hypothetical protein
MYQKNKLKDTTIYIKYVSLLALRNLQRIKFPREKIKNTY